MITEPHLAESIEAATAAFFDRRPEPGDRAMACLMVSLLLQALSLKTGQEPIAAAIARMKESLSALDLLNDDHRQMMARILHEMFSPLGIKNLIVVGLSGEKAFITTFQPEGVEPMPVPQVKSILGALSESDGESEMFL